MNAFERGECAMIIPLQGAEGYVEDGTRIAPDGFTTSIGTTIRLEKPEGDDLCRALVVNFTPGDIHVGHPTAGMVDVYSGRAFIMELARGQVFIVVMGPGEAV